MQKSILCFLTVLLTVLLTGCQPPGVKVYHQTEGNVAEVTQRINDMRHRSNANCREQPTLTVNQGLYVDKTPIILARDPVWLRNRIVVRGDELPFSYYSRLIAGGGGRNILTRYQVGMDPSATKVSFNYTGTVRGALDLLAAKTGFVYNINGNNIYWQAFITKTFDIAFMPGATDYMMGKAQGGGTLNAGGAGGGAGGGNTVTAMIDDSAASQYSSLKGTLSVWKDLQNSITQLLSPDGKVMVSESTTTVTVRDRPSNVALISTFINNLNKNLSKQVLVKVQVLSIQLSNDFVFGVNWDIVQRMFLGGGTNFVLNSNQGIPVSITNLGSTTTTQTGIQPSNPNASTGYSALINALTQQGKVSIVSEPRVVCLNNQVSEIRIVTQEGYLASVQNTTPGGSLVGSSTVTSQLTPGTLITGLTLYILPKIMGNKVIMQVNADLSVKNSITSFSSQTGTSTPPTTGAAPGSFIQLPNVTQKQFNQRSIIGTGDTLILAGFRQVQNTANATQLLGMQALGGRGALQDNSDTIVLITPIILHGCV